MGSQGRGRRRRSKIRKQRFASLRQQLAPPISVLSGHQQQQLLAPQLDDEEQSPSSLFEPNYDVETTINSIFGSTTVESPESPSDSVSHGRDVGGDEASLARVALKGRERWVFCKEEGEGESITSACGGFIESCTSHLCLKLDYEKIVSAWSGKGSLYVEGEGHQVVPQLNQPCVYVEVGGSGMNNTASPSSCCSGLWSVPENSRDPKMEMNNKGGTREERVMRYREKRRSRLFSKSIRYEVRKINAEKRPRIKGRFVKRVEDEV